MAKLPFLLGGEQEEGCNHLKFSKGVIYNTFASLGGGKKSPRNSIKRENRLKDILHQTSLLPFSH